jgi:hypothetical protein
MVGGHLILCSFPGSFSFLDSRLSGLSASEKTEQLLKNIANWLEQIIMGIMILEYNILECQGQRERRDGWKPAYLSYLAWSSS